MELKRQRRLQYYFLIVLFIGSFGTVVRWIQHPAGGDEHIEIENNSERSFQLPEVREDQARSVSAHVSQLPTSTVPTGSVQRVFRLVLNGEMCSLEASELVRGDFRQRRGAPETHPGMIVSRMVDNSGAILAEEFTHAPDHVCTVLDPNLDGRPVPARLTSDGPHVFQVRFPQEIEAAELQVHRITRTEPALTTDLLLVTALKP